MRPSNVGNPRRLLTISLVAVVAVFAMLEVVLHVAQGGCYRFVPYDIEDHIASLAPDSSFCVLSGRDRVSFATDIGGARRATANIAAYACDRCVLGVGDSQVLGYITPFDQTFTALYASRTKRDAALVAAPRNDPDTERLAVRSYIARTATAPDVALVAVNLGNDLDELYLGRREVRGNWQTSDVGRWLREHSLVIDNVVLNARIVAREHDRDPSRRLPGITPVAAVLEPDDVPIVIDELANAVATTIAATHARAAAAIVIPPDDAVDPDQFARYRAYYSAGEFASWSQQLQHLASVMTTVENGLDARLRAGGVNVVDVRDLVARAPGTVAFDPTSHQLSAAANRLVANALP